MFLRHCLVALIWLAAVVPVYGENLVVILLGPPGSGKSTQATYLRRKYGIPTVSAADLIKRGHGGKSPVSRAVAAPTASGDLLNEEGLNQLVRYRVEKRDALSGFILDGYPTSKKQAEYLASLLDERKLPPPVVIVLDAPDSVVKSRMNQRRRVDDKPAVIERRIADYRREEQFIVDYYGKGRLYRVDATKTEREVSAQIGSVLGGGRP